jgi:selenophosphate synthase
MRSFQARVLNWLMNCFSQEICRDTHERNHRFLEEALELVQSTGCTQAEAHQLVDYVFGRPVGDPFQEVGGTTITLSALCSCIDIDQLAAGEAELARISAPAILDKIRAKQAAKPRFGPLPQ